jgi:hypothetical protein
MWNTNVEHTAETRKTTAKLLKSLTWLGDLDSNQGCPGQSREFYR